MAPSTNPYLSDLITLLQFGGLWFEQANTRFGRLVPYLQASRIAVIIILEIAMLASAVRSGPGFFKNPSSGYTTFGIVVILMSIPFTVGRSELQLLLATLDRSFHKLLEPWQESLLKGELTRSWQIIRFYITFTLGFTVLFPLIGLTIDIVHFYLGWEVYKYPMSLDMYDSGTAHTPFHFTITFLSYVWLNLIGTQNVAVIGSMFIFTAFLKGYLRILIRLFESLQSGKDRITWRMKDLVMFHQQIISIHESYTNILGFPFAAQCVLGGINLCLLVIGLVNFSNGALLIFILVSIYSATFVGLLLICCMEGETLQQQNSLLHYAIYNVEWYRQPAEVQRSILMMMHQAQRPMSLDFKRSLPLNLKTFSQTISTAYSYFNLYLKSQ